MNYELYPGPRAPQARHHWWWGTGAMVQVNSAGADVLLSSSIACGGYIVVSLPCLTTPSWLSSDLLGRRGMARARVEWLAWCSSYAKLMVTTYYPYKPTFISASSPCLLASPSCISSSACDTWACSLDALSRMVRVCSSCRRPFLIWVRGGSGGRGAAVEWWLVVGCGARRVSDGPSLLERVRATSCRQAPP